MKKLVLMLALLMLVSYGAHAQEDPLIATAKACVRGNNSACETIGMISRQMEEAKARRERERRESETAPRPFVMTCIDLGGGMVTCSGM